MVRAASRMTSSRGVPAAFASRMNSAKRTITSSPSPGKNRSMKSAIGSGQAAPGPPAMTMGSSGPRSALSSGMPARSSMASTFVASSSYCRLKAATSKPRTGRKLSSA